MSLGSSSAQEAVSIVIVNYNCEAILTACVRSCLEHARQIIVVDNGSSDSSVELLAERFAASTNLQIIRNDRNLGFSAGCNIGLSAATEPYILFLNPDCVLGTDSLHRMVQVLEADPKAGMAGGMLVNPDGTEQRGSRRTIPTPWRSFVYVFGLQRFTNRWPRLFADFNLYKQSVPDGPIEVEAISGALMLVKRVAIEDVGSLDENYFLHCEDLDWYMRFRQRGWKIMFVPNTSVVHHRGMCSQPYPIFVEWHKHKGMMRFYRKFFHHQYPGVLMWIVAVGVWLRFSAVVIRYSIRYIRQWLTHDHL